MHKVDKLLNKARDSTVGRSKPIPYVGGWKGYEQRTGISCEKGELYLNNFGKNGRPRYSLDDKELNELEDVLVNVLNDVIDREGVVKEDHRRVRTKLKEIIGNDTIYETARACPHCGVFLASYDGELTKLENRSAVEDVERNREHSCDYTNEGEHIVSVNILKIKQIYPEEKPISPPEIIHSTN